MQIAGKCYDEVPPPPKELKPMLEALYERMLEEQVGAGSDWETEGDMTPWEYFIMWWEEIGCK